MDKLTISSGIFVRQELAWSKDLFDDKYDLVIKDNPCDSYYYPWNAAFKNNIDKQTIEATRPTVTRLPTSNDGQLELKIFTYHMLQRFLKDIDGITAIYLTDRKRVPEKIIYVSNEGENIDRFKVFTMVDYNSEDLVPFIDSLTNLNQLNVSQGIDHKDYVIQKHDTIFIVASYRKMFSMY